jgi:methylenetetrahydromethanopterin dehydrogenase
MVKIGVFKCGNIAAAPLLELLLDELGDREGLAVRTVTTGSKMEAEAIQHSIEKLLEFNPDLVLFASPNTAAPGPATARAVLSLKRISTVVLTDAPGERVTSEMERQGLGYIIIAGDPLIGARREFLDSTEMAIFNANVMKILAATGVFRIVVQEVDRLVDAMKAGANPSLPRRVVDTDSIRDSVAFRNPYARVKAMAAYEILKKVAEIDFQACFVEKEKEKYIPLVACAHELVQAGASLAEEAREIEKHGDTLLRTPHSKEGRTKTKDKLMLSPQ